MLAVALPIFTDDGSTRACDKLAKEGDALIVREVRQILLAEREVWKDRLRERATRTRSSTRD